MHIKKPICKELKIPKRLHSNGRPIIKEFFDDEIVYRWFAPHVEIDIEGHISTAYLGEAFKPPHETSVNRSRLCIYSTDVLYNQHKLPHRFAYGVIKAAASSINGFTFESSPLKNKVEFKLEHAPEPCMYPHTNIAVYLNDSLITKNINSKILKADIRDELRTLFTLCHTPDPNFKPARESMSILDLVIEFVSKLYNKLIRKQY